MFILWDELDTGLFEGCLDLPERPNGTHHFSGLLGSLHRVDPYISP
jgi:hypothetical protein